jgi:hypothetical protein
MKNGILYYYHLVFMYGVLCFGTVMMAVIPIMLISYISGILHPNGGNWPWWSIFFIAVYGTVGFLIRKAAVWELHRQKALQKGAE